jgi:diphosphomevalonate decarboxylase
MAARARPSVTYEAPPNIALVKYWGVRDRDRALPYNSSLSVTLGGMRSRTTVQFRPDLVEDAVRLNGSVATGGPRDGVVRFLDRVRALASTDERAAVDSSNNFPTASGLASSASGFAALAGAATRAAGRTLSDRALSQLARFGSGSACRSVFGGFVVWNAGHRPDGRDCYARSLYGPDHWPELVDLVLLVRDAPVKEVRSADAMQTSVRTSDYFAERQREIPGRLARIRAAIGARRADRLFPLIMEECDSFRKVCETSRPSLDYLTSTSREILDAVRAENRQAGRAVAGYTHDAGAHVHVFTLQRDLRRLRRALGALDGVERTLVVRPGPGGHVVRGGGALARSTGRGGRTRATGARGRSRRSAR